MKKNKNVLNRPTLERLLLYYHYIKNHLYERAGPTVSSAQIAGLIRLDGTQVRKDLAAIGVKGCRRVGFSTAEVLTTIRGVLGFDTNNQAVLVGTGRLGGAIASYKGFDEYGLNIIAMFDIDPKKIGLVINGHVVQPLEQLEPIIKQHAVELAILTVPAEPAQNLANRLVKAGINAIWNFSPTRLTVPHDGIVIRHEHLAVGLAELSYHLKRSKY